MIRLFLIDKLSRIILNRCIECLVLESRQGRVFINYFTIRNYLCRLAVIDRDLTE